MHSGCVAAEGRFIFTKRPFYQDFVYRCPTLLATVLGLFQLKALSFTNVFHANGRIYITDYVAALQSETRKPCSLYLSNLI